MAEHSQPPGDALQELHEILLLAALDDPPTRHTATRYTHCRDLLLKSELRPILPGFLQQCMTIDRFRDFIHLYHSRLEARVGFIDDAMRAGLARAGRDMGQDMLGGVGR